MKTYWTAPDINDEDLWAHEWAKYGTCISALDPPCYSDYTPQQEVVDYFQFSTRYYPDGSVGFPTNPGSVRITLSSNPIFTGFTNTVVVTLFRIWRSQEFFQVLPRHIPPTKLPRLLGSATLPCSSAKGVNWPIYGGTHTRTWRRIWSTALDFLFLQVHFLFIRRLLHAPKNSIDWLGANCEPSWR